MRESDDGKTEGGAGSPQTIELLKPVLEGGKSLASSLRLRRTEREFSDRPLPPQILSDLLWAACEINRRDGPFGVSGRTAASASNSQEVDVYVALREGTYRYEPMSHSLTLKAAGDLRRLALGDRQGATGVEAPVRLIYVADVEKLEHTAGFEEAGLHDPEIQRSYYCVDTGLIASNVYLFAASRGLAAWFHNCDRPAIAAALGFQEGERPLFGQTVGYPKRKDRRKG